MALISPDLLQNASQLIAQLKLNPSTAAAANDLKEQVGKCMGEYWDDGEKGNAKLQDMLSKFATRTPESIQISTNTPAKTNISSLIGMTLTFETPTSNQTDAYPCDTGTSM